MFHRSILIPLFSVYIVPKSFLIFDASIENKKTSKYILFEINTRKCWPFHCFRVLILNISVWKNDPAVWFCSWIYAFCFKDILYSNANVSFVKIFLDIFIGTIVVMYLLNNLIARSLFYIRSACLKTCEEIFS